MDSGIFFLFLMDRSSSTMMLAANMMSPGEMTFPKWYNAYQLAGIRRRDLRSLQMKWRSSPCGREYFENKHIGPTFWKAFPKYNLFNSRNY